MSDEEDWGGDGDGDDGGWGDEGGDGDGWGDGEADAGDDGWAEDPADDSGDGAGPRVELENTFFMARDTRRDDPAAALTMFRKCVSLEKASFEDEMIYRFQSLEHIVTLEAALGNMDAMTEAYQELLSYTDRVTRNEVSESINTVLTTVSESKDFALLQRVYRITLDALSKLSGQERMHFDIAMRLAKTHLDRGEITECEKQLHVLHDKLRLPDGSDDMSRGSQLLEIYAIKIQLATDSGNTTLMQDLFEKTRILSSEVTDPRSMSTIQECWGKMYANAGNWKDAYTQFFNAFLQYQEVGSDRAKQCLKYVVIANMIGQGSSNPFDAREAKVYQQLPEIDAMVQLRMAYEDSDIRTFQKILKRQPSLTRDTFISQHLDKLLYRVRSEALVTLVKPYKRIKLESIAKFLNITVLDVEKMLISLILDETVIGRVDQVNGVLDLTLESTASVKKFSAVDDWSRNLKALTDGVSSKVTATTGRQRGNGMDMMGGGRRSGFLSMMGDLMFRGF